ncbi:SEC-C metal-binding domain-containing protein, partial [Campylobacter concisus]|uniref:SEC-C metal-binding domain-containing protein n=1 Tax=Campylobacter concisus TaxID=199 RepID=UPI0015E1AB7F
YDDVANEQRKVIYKYRNELLDPNFVLKEKIKENRKDYVISILADSEIYDGISKDDFNLESVKAQILSETGEEIDLQNLKGVEFDELVLKISEFLENSYEEKMKILDENQRNEIEKVIYLQIVDKDWREHLYQMDVLKTGIGLRGYNHKDPLTEYKKDSYNMFMDLVARLKRDSIRMLQIIRFTQETQEKEADKFLDKMEERSKISSPTKKPARNQPCPCGSGKIYAS